MGVLHTHHEAVGAVFVDGLRQCIALQFWDVGIKAVNVLFVDGIFVRVFVGICHASATGEHTLLATSQEARQLFLLQSEHIVVGDGHRGVDGITTPIWNGHSLLTGSPCRNHQMERYGLVHSFHSQFAVVDGGCAQVVHLHNEVGLRVALCRRRNGLVLALVEQDGIAELVFEIGCHTVDFRSAVGIAHQIAAVDFLVGHIPIEVVDRGIAGNLCHHQRCSHVHIVAVGH